MKAIGFVAGTGPTLALGLFLSTAPAGAAPSASHEAADTRVVARLDEVGRALLYKPCHGAPTDASCSLDHDARKLAIDAPGALDGGHASFSAVPVGARFALHVKIPLAHVSPDERAWEAVLVPGAPSVAAAGLTGFARGEPGERSGVRVVELPATDGRERPELVVGEIHEDRRICGQAETLIAPRAFDPASLTLRGVTLPRLSEEARASATRLTAEATSAAALPAPLAPLVRATSTSADGSAAALTDGNPSTAWSEQRSGDGHGEFVTLTAAPELPIDCLAFTLLPTAPSTPTAPDAPSARPAPADLTPPHTVHLATGAHVYEITFPPAPHAPAGDVIFVVKLPEPLATGCLSLVLDRPEGARPHPVVTLAEVTAYGPFDGAGATVAAVAKALDDDALGDGAVQELARMGDAGVRAAGARLPALRTQGQRRALTVAESGSCETAAPLFVTELARTGVTAEAAARSERALRRCDKRAAPALLAALAAPHPSAEVARVAAEVAPDGALPLLMQHVASAPESTPGEAGFRDALSRAAERASSGAVVKTLDLPIASASAPASTRLTLVRALHARAAEIAPVATPIALAAARDPVAARRYLAVDPLVALAATVPDARAALVALESDSAWTVRLRLAERADEVAELIGWAPHAVDDAAPRVREAALGSLARKHQAPAEVAAHAGDGEEWTFVRLAAITALQADTRTGNARADIDETLARATTEDPSLEVRTAALDGLSARGGATAAKLVRQLLDREDLSAEVRAGAARAAGTLCLRDQADHLTELSRPLGNLDTSESARLVAVQALAALARLHPKDLARRVAPYGADGAPAEARAAARQALAPHHRTVRPMSERIDPHEALRRMRDATESWIYVDVRSEEEFAEGHPEGALNVPILRATGAHGELEANDAFLSTLTARFSADTPPHPRLRERSPVGPRARHLAGGRLQPPRRPARRLGRHARRIRLARPPRLVGRQAPSRMTAQT